VNPPYQGFGIFRHPESGSDGVGQGGRDMASAESGGVGIFVVDPDLHLQIFSEVHGMLE
jgi:hypothetical protein